MQMTGRRAALAVCLASLSGALATTPAYADDTPNPCDALKRIVAAAPNFASLSAIDGRAIALSHGDDVKCAASQTNYRCTWTPRGGSGAEALQGVAADIASCLPDATHDQNAPARQHFYLGARGARTEISVAQAGSNKLTLEIYGSR
ncbi:MULTISPECIES: hypothetical protein [Caballeronia]|uniref:hypothetical protein n=1 Tax=Caballeronia TaxID=1827195 RepID=UPI00045F0845|nr:MULTISPECIES: hypothetical protein [unclassified Caballeronia]MCE4543525.1 hypothetical protein [Caballeronia sp. PC1]MCE4567419.1 hypothetical protein [Caballeronia sp. CLC5]BAO87624.1 putative uncharacterized protein [Burkholderia sp. RPE67]